MERGSVSIGKREGREKERRWGWKGIYEWGKGGGERADSDTALNLPVKGSI